MLSDLLLAPAALRHFMTLREFTDVFPRGHRDNDAVPDLYHELKRLRERDMDVVRRDIVEEVKRSRQLRREYAQERRLHDATVAGVDPIALEMEEELSGQTHGRPHTLPTVHASIEKACDGLEAQIAQLERETEEALQNVQDVVGGLSDLRQGRFPQSVGGEDMGEEVLATLRRLETVCVEAFK